MNDDLCILSDLQNRSNKLNLLLRLSHDLLALIEQRPQRLIIDLTHVGYMDSSGVGTLVELKRRFEQLGGKLVLLGLQSRVRSVFEITRLDRFFVIARDLNEARTA